MAELWAKIGFFAFVLAPLWSLFLSFLVNIMVKNDRLKVILTTFLVFIVVQTFFGDMLFLLVGVLGGTDSFVAVWNFFWHGAGLWWWLWSGIGFLLATIAYSFSDFADDLYIKESFSCTVLAGMVFFVILFLIYAANAVAAGLPLG